jgi:sugar/nucleoside kinase (ribokinase family)
MNGVREDGVTGKCMVFVTPDAERTMNSFLGISLTLDHQVLDFEALEQSEYLYIEGYLVTSPSAKEAVVKALDFAKEKGIKTALTFSDPSMAKFFGDGLKEMLGENGVDLLFCNTEEALTFTQTQTLEEAIPELKKWARAFAVTRSEKGALLFDGEREIDVLTQQVKPIDTNGAGDLFAGAFMYALTQGHSFGEAGKLACACSSQLVTQFGPRLRKDQAQEIKNTILNND